MKSIALSVSDLLARLTQLEERTARAEERATQAEARADRLENATGNLAAAVVNPKPISRRNLLTKAAAVGAAGVAGTLFLNRKDAHASFAWTGGAANTADLPTTVNAAMGFPGPTVLKLDADQTLNGSTGINGLESTATGTFSGVAAFGGNKGGPAFFGFGGNGVAGTGGNQAGAMLRGGSGVNIPGGSNWAAVINGHGASDGTANGRGMFLAGGGQGYGLFAIGGRGTVATPHVNGGTAIFAYGGPGVTAVQILGDAFSLNTGIAAHGVQGAGNALGVGGYFSGGRAQVQIIPNGGTGAPTAGPHFRGDLYMDVKEVIWVCIADGTPGTFAPLQPGGMNNALFTATSTQQYLLANSDGAAWTAMDTALLKLTITPAFNCQAVLTANSDLWTTVAGFNQDIGISISGGAYPTVAGQPEAWKESGGFAGTFSPNAAYVETVSPLAAGVAYTIQVVWKTNKAGSSTIAAGAGPINGQFSPTRLTAQLVATNPGGTIPLSPAVPFTRDIPQLTPPGADPYGRKVGS